MSKNITVYNIAEKLGVSAGTVSRALNGSSLISNERSELIRRTAKEMGYRKRQIRRPESRAILNIILFLPYSTEPQYHLFYDPAQLVSGIRSGFGDTRVNIIAELNDGSLTVLNNRKVGDIDGVVFAFTDPPETITAILNKRKIPMLLLNREDKQFNYITLDNEGAINKLFSLVLEAKKDVFPFYIGLKGAEKVNSYRKKAFLKACKNYQIKKSEVLDISSFEEISPDLLKEIQKRQFNWIVCFNDIVAVSALSSSTLAEITIPEEMSITGFDNSPLRNVFSRKIDTIDLEVNKMGKRAGEWLFKGIMEKIEEPIQEEVKYRYISGDTIGRTI